MDMINVKINGNEYSVPKGSTILDAARAANIDIPTLCYLKGINEIGACRLCLVEVKGARGLMAACVTPANDGMEIFTNTPKIQKNRKTNLELVLSTHKRKCLSCIRSQDCELQKLCRDYGVDDEEHFEGKYPEPTHDESTAFLVRDNEKCILCRRCVGACQNMQGIGVISANNRGFDTHIASAFELPLASTSCVSCGQCIVACPVGALHEKDDTEKVWDALSDPTKHVAICTAPSIRATIGECFGFEPGVDTEGKMVSAIKALGFDGVYDMNLTADLTIMEEATEFLDRVKNGGKLPLITSCSPGWIKFCEHYYPEFIPNLSTCKSPQQMYGALVKSYYAEHAGIDPRDIFVVSVMPCTAKKFECKRPELGHDGMADVDVSLTTRELAQMIRQAGILFDRLPDEKCDDMLGEASGAGHIFGATGGVMEAALRTVYEVVTGKTLEKVEFTAVRGVEAIKEAEYDLNGTKVKVAVTSGLDNAKKLLDMVKSGEKDYTFIEVMACPGGCVNGGGQPIVPSMIRNFVDVRKVRAEGLYKEDAGMPLRKSHENPQVQRLYKEYLGEPNSHKAHELLHTHYTSRGLYNR